MSGNHNDGSAVRRLAAFSLLVLVLSTGATQYLAHRLGYQAALGRPWTGCVYAPWSWLGWAHAHHRAAPELFERVFVLFALGLVLGFVPLLALGPRRSTRYDTIHGSAHFATEEEIRATGLLPRRGERGSGVYVGAWTDRRGRVRYLRHDGPEHVLAVAPTRSGKGVGLVVPTLLSWPESALVHDIKGELYELTAGWRKTQAGNIVLRFDPAAAKGSCAFNPLEEVRLGTPSEVSDVQNLVTIIVDPDGKGLRDHWTKTAHALLTGVILHLAYQARKARTLPTLERVALALSDPKRPVDALWAEMLANEHRPGGETHPVVAAAARDMKNRPEQERGSVLSTAMSYLSLYRDPLVARNTRASDFRVSDLMDHQKPVSLYLVVRPADKDRLKPLMRLILNQIVRGLVRQEIRFKEGRPLPAHEHRLLLMLDEFPSFGRLEVFQEALAFIAGYGMKAYLITQDFAQLWGAYGREESIVSNCHIRIAYAPNKVETAELLSKMTGQATVVKDDVSISRRQGSFGQKNISTSTHHVQRPLLTHDEIMRLKAPLKDARGQILEPGEMLIFAAGHAPIHGNQPLYFQDPVFASRARLEAPTTERIEASSRAAEKATAEPERLPEPAEGGAKFTTPPPQDSAGKGEPSGEDEAASTDAEEDEAGETEMEASSP